jgi:hypothetical protein
MIVINEQGHCPVMFIGHGGNYVPKVLALLRAHPETISEIDIKHDNWCSVHTNRPCNCDPDVALTREAA